jgi:hypothetical protein
MEIGAAKSGVRCIATSCTCGRFVCEGSAPTMRLADSESLRCCRWRVAPPPGCTLLRIESHVANPLHLMCDFNELEPQRLISSANGTTFLAERVSSSASPLCRAPIVHR